MAELTSRRPYLIRALYDWVLDNDLTPHLLVAADADGVDVPRQFVTEDGKITVNISPGMTSEAIRCSRGSTGRRCAWGAIAAAAASSSATIST